MSALQESLRVLVVDDNVDAAVTLSMLLKMTGHETHLAHDGVQALAVAEEFRPHVALLDIGLPKMNGYEVAQWIRAQPWGRTMVLVAATGWGQDDDLQRSCDAGFNHHLVKPVRYDDIEALMRSLQAVS